MDSALSRARSQKPQRRRVWAVGGKGGGRGKTYPRGTLRAVCVKGGGGRGIMGGRGGTHVVGGGTAGVVVHGGEQ